MAHLATTDFLASEIAVESLLMEPLLRDRLLVGKAGLDRLVEWCLPLSEINGRSPAGADGAEEDLAGIMVHAPAGELASAGHARALVAELARRGAAALLAWPDGGAEVDLSQVARAADDAALPLVGLAREADYHRVGRLVAVKALAGATHVLEYSARVHRTLGEIFATGSGLPALARSMSTLAGTAVLVTDADGKVLSQYAGPETRLTAELAAQLHYRAAAVTGPSPAARHPAPHLSGQDVILGTAEGLVHAVVAPVRVAGELFGTVAVVESAVPPHPHDIARHRVIVEQGAPLIASEMLRQRSVAEAEERARDDFVDTLVHGRFTDVHELEARSRHYRFDVQAPHAVFVVSVPQCAERHDQQLLRAVSAKAGTASTDLFTLATYTGKTLVVVRQIAVTGAAGRWDAKAEQAEILAFGRHLSRSAGHRAGTDVQVAYGRAACGAAGVAASYREARIALELSHRVDVPAVCGYDQLRVFAAIEQAAASARGREFADEILDPLRRADGQTGNLEQVVLAYIAESGNLNAAARRLQLHRNTMLYKLDRASRVLQMDVRSSETQFTVWLAHRIKTLNQSLRTLDTELSPPAKVPS